MVLMITVAEILQDWPSSEITRDVLLIVGSPATDFRHLKTPVRISSEASLTHVL